MNTYKMIMLFQFFLLSLIVSGCSSTAQQAPAQSEGATSVTLTPEQQQALLNMLEEHNYNAALLQSWQESQPGVRRLLAIESELKLLIEQLNEISASQQSQSSAPDVGEEEASQPSSTSPSSSQQKRSQASSEEGEGDDILPGMFALQVAALEQVEKVRAYWDNLAGKHPALFESLTPYYEEASVSGSRLFRLKTGKFVQREEADAMCARFKQANIPCMVSRYGDTVRVL